MLSLNSLRNWSLHLCCVILQIGWFPSTYVDEEGPTSLSWSLEPAFSSTVLRENYSRKRTRPGEGGWKKKQQHTNKQTLFPLLFFPTLVSVSPIMHRLRFRSRSLWGFYFVFFPNDVIFGSLYGGRQDEKTTTTIIPTTTAGPLRVCVPPRGLSAETDWLWIALPWKK